MILRIAKPEPRDHSRRLRLSSAGVASRRGVYARGLKGVPVGSFLRKCRVGVEQLPGHGRYIEFQRVDTHHGQKR